jgi:hypothetical protein
MSQQAFPVAIRRVLDRTQGSRPVSFVRAIQRELAPLLDALSRRRPDVDADEVRKILVQLVENAILAAIGTALMQSTGMSRRALLRAIGCDVPWPWGLLPGSPRGGRCSDEVRRIESAMGCGLRRFLRMPLRDKFQTLGIYRRKSWLTLVLEGDDGTGNFSITVRSDIPASPEDRTEILRRFQSWREVLQGFADAEKKAEEAGGVFQVVSFTGGGGFGLAYCIHAAARLRLEFSYVRGKAAAGTTTFRLSTRRRTRAHPW